MDFPTISRGFLRESEGNFRLIPVGFGKWRARAMHGGIPVAVYRLSAFILSKAVLLDRPQPLRKGRRNNGKVEALGMVIDVDALRLVALGSSRCTAIP
jgi:hypothetical protein